MGIADWLSDCGQFTSPLGASLCSSVEWMVLKTFGKQVDPVCQKSI